MTYEEVKQEYELTLNILREDSRLLSVWIDQTAKDIYQWLNDVTPREIQRIADDLDNAYELNKYFDTDKQYFIWQDTLQSYTEEVRQKYSQWLDLLSKKGYYTTSHILGETLSGMAKALTPHISFDKDDDFWKLIAVFIGISLLFGVVLFAGD